MSAEAVQTEYLVVDPNAPDAKIIARAAAILRGGGLVAFPTETVYGLGANALDAEAVRRIFLAKGRPSHNPLIVHVPDVASAQPLVAAWTETAARLAQRFWPGPLTLVLPRSELVPDAVTGGGATVALRVPANPVALALLRAAGVPLAAPSANRSNSLSPTRAEHVRSGLNGRIALILDGGQTTGGLESTVLDLTTSPPRLLRPGLVTPAEIEAVLGVLDRSAPAASNAPPGSALLSPGMLARHYAPHAPLEIAPDDGADRVQTLLHAGERVGWLTFSAVKDSPALTIVRMPSEAAAYAAQLFDRLHWLDGAGVTRIVVACPPDGDEWLAIRDRLRRAAASLEETAHAPE